MERIDQMIDAFYRLLGEKAGFLDPVHPAVVHMPIGLIAGAFIFILFVIFLHIFRRSEGLAIFLSRASNAMIVLAFIFWFITVFFGFIDWRHWYGGAWLSPIKAKMWLAGALLFILLFTLIVGREIERRWKGIVPLYALGMLAIIGLGYYGGRLTYGGRSPEPPPAYQAGFWQYHHHCSMCHPDGGNVITPNMVLIDSPFTKDSKVFENWVRHPAPPMPAYPPAIITGEDMKNLYDYIDNVINKLTTQ
jgi:hypothetical protein